MENNLKDLPWSVTFDKFDFILLTIITSITLTFMMLLILGVILYLNIKNRYSIERFILSRRYLYPLIKKGLGVYNFSKSDALVLINLLQSYVADYYGSDKIETNFDPVRETKETDLESLIIIKNPKFLFLFFPKNHISYYFYHYYSFSS